MSRRSHAPICPGCRRAGTAQIGSTGTVARCGDFPDAPFSSGPPGGQLEHESAGGRPGGPTGPGSEDDWWGQLYDDASDDTGPAPAADSLDDRFASAAGTVSAGGPGAGADSPPAPDPGRPRPHGRPPGPRCSRPSAGHHRRRRRRRRPPSRPAPRAWLLPAPRAHHPRLPGAPGVPASAPGVRHAEPGRPRRPPPTPPLRVPRPGPHAPRPATPVRPLRSHRRPRLRRLDPRRARAPHPSR